ncbi:MAG: 30S ribosome-binding factor RbfA [Gammaproteobacteria bacterium]
MPHQYPRAVRVGEQVHRKLALLMRELKDPRIGMVTVADVELSPDYAHAKVFVSTLGDAQQIETSLAGLRSAAGFLRRELSRALNMRSTPELHFVYDDTQEKGARISALLDRELGERPPDQDEDEG